MSLFAGTKFYKEPICETCGLADKECQCVPPEPEKILVDPAKQTALIRKEKRQKGKLVTVIRGLSEEDNDLPQLLKQLKNRCGSGGSIQAESIEIQGDCRQQVQSLLAEAGYKTRIEN